MFKYVMLLFPVVNLVDIYNMIEAFRENGLHVLDHNMEIHESRLEAILSSIFYALNKRIPSTTDIDVERCIALVKHWLLYAYDRYCKCEQKECERKLCGCLGVWWVFV